MVAVIRPGKSLRRALNYNEQKVKQQKAECLIAVNYPKEVEDLNFYQKLSRLTNQATLRPRSQVNSVHLSLNFDPSEKLADEKMKLIAQDYMQRIGFGDQPYLIYRHNDSGHPHLHIVTTNIKADGGKIDLHNIGKNISESVRKQIEEDYHLVKASSKSIRQTINIPKVDAQKVMYGKSETKRAITNVLDKVVSQYKYTSLAELNAVLQLYNVKAERGKEDSVLFQKGGLLYRVLDENGKVIGVPIKSSSIYSKPTLKALEANFSNNKEARKPHRQRITNAIQWALHNRKLSLRELGYELRKEGIQTIIRSNEEGFAFGITFVDHKTKCVFNGSDLGKGYSIKAIQEKCNPEEIVQTLSTAEQHFLATDNKGTSILSYHHIISNTNQPSSPPGELRFDRKKKKKRKLRL